MDDKSKIWQDTALEDPDIAKFAESYETFNRIINSLQRKYLELKEEFTTQNDQLTSANRKLVDLTEQNITATEFLNSILNSISAGVVAVNRQGVITHFNPAASSILGIPQQEPLGQQYRELIPSGVPAGANAYRTAETGSTVDGVEKTVELADGTLIQLSVSTALLMDQEQGITGAVEVMHDLTKIKKMEKELTRLNTLAALGEMAATIAHQVRNPLAAIGGFASLLEKDLDPKDEKQHLVAKIKKGVSSLNDTIETVLNYTRYEELNKSDVVYQTFLYDMVKLFQHERPKQLAGFKIDVREEGYKPVPRVSLSLDKMLFRQVFFNLFQNAYDACHGNGTLKINMGLLSRQNAIREYGEKLMPAIDETLLVTKIKDTGPGIKEEHREKVFLPFYTTKSKGNGLGLAVVWKIVKAHGGEVFVDDSASDGTTIILLLPVSVNQGDGA